MGRVSRNCLEQAEIITTLVTPRMGRVSRNDMSNHSLDALVQVTPRMGRVSRNCPARYP